jgi:hypothetical protein
MNKKHTTFILMISIFIAFCAIFAFIFFLRTIQNKNEHISKVLLTLSEKMEDKKNTDILNSKFVELESIQHKINNYFIDPNKIDTFVDFLEKLGLNNNTELVIKNVEILSKKKNGIFVKVLITGDFTDVMKVVYLLENLSFNVNLNQVFINKESRVVENEIESIGEDEKKEKMISFWQADVSFDVLTLPQESDKEKDDKINK